MVASAQLRSGARRADYGFGRRLDGLASLGPVAVTALRQWLMYDIEWSVVPSSGSGLDALVLTIGASLTWQPYVESPSSGIGGGDLTIDWRIARLFLRSGSARASL